MFDDLIDFLYVSVLALLIIVLIFFVVGVPILSWHSAKKEAEIINQKFGTHYTTKDMLLAGDTIEKVIQGYKIRIDKEK